MIHLEPFNLSAAEVETEYLRYRKTLYFVCLHADKDIQECDQSSYLKDAIAHFKQMDDAVIERWAIDNLHLGINEALSEYDPDAWISGEDGYRIIKKAFNQ